jgi:hypothetical protein
MLYSGSNQHVTCCFLPFTSLYREHVTYTTVTASLNDLLVGITPAALNERVYRICQNNFIASTSFVQHCGLCLGSYNIVNIFCTNNLTFLYLCLVLYYDKIIIDLL